MRRTPPEYDCPFLSIFCPFCPFFLARFSKPQKLTTLHESAPCPIPPILGDLFDSYVNCKQLKSKKLKVSRATGNWGTFFHTATNRTVNSAPQKVWIFWKSHINPSYHCVFHVFKILFSLNYASYYHEFKLIGN